MPSKHVFSNRKSLRFFFLFRFLFTQLSACSLRGHHLNRSPLISTATKVLLSRNICFIESALWVKFNHYLALAHSALTSFSLMSSQRLSCSICRSRSLMSPIVTHIGRKCSHSTEARAHTHSCDTWGGGGSR